MATRTWKGGTGGSTTDYSVAGNWVEGAVPIAGDDVVIMRHPDETQYAITAGLNQAGVAIATFSIHHNYTANIAATGGYLLLNVTDEVNVAGDSESFLDLTAGQTNTIRIEMDESYSKVTHIKGGTGGNTVTAAHFMRGGIQWVSGTISTTYVSLADDAANDVELEWLAGSSTATIVTAGETEIVSGTVSGLVMHGGLVVNYDGTVADPNIYGGEYDHRATTTLGSGISVWGSGTFTAANDNREKDLAQIICYGAPTVNLDNGANNMTFSIDEIGRATIIYPRGGYTI